MMQKRKISFLKQLGIALARPDQYGQLMAVGTGRMIGFTLLFAIVYLIVWVISVFNLMYAVSGPFQQFINNDIPDFYIEGGELHMDKSYNLKVERGFIMADTEVEQFTLKDLQYVMDTNQYDVIILISKKNSVIRNENGEIAEVKFSDLGNQYISKNILITNMMNGVKKYLFILPVIGFPFYAIAHLIMGFLLMIFAFIISLITRKSLSGRELFRIGVYTYVVIAVVGLILQWFPIYSNPLICFFIYAAFALVYLVLGVFSAGKAKVTQNQYLKYDSIYGYGGQENSVAYSNNNGNYGNSFNTNNNFMNTSFQTDDAFSNEPITIEEPIELKKPVNAYQTENTADNSFEMQFPSYETNVIGGSGVMQQSDETRSFLGNTMDEKILTITNPAETTAADIISGETIPSAASIVETATTDTFLLNGVVCDKSDMDLIDKYILVGLKDSAIHYLCNLTHCTNEAAAEIISNWKQYYNG